MSSWSSFDWPALVMPPSAEPGVPMSVEVWADLPEDAEGEIVNGLLMEDEAPSLVHELVVAWFLKTLQLWLDGTGFVFGSDTKLIVGPNTGRKPDLSVYLPGHARLPLTGAVRVPPDILLEVISPSPRDERRDRVHKMEEYACFGVRYYWLLDPALAALEIFELGSDGRYTKALAATEGQVTPPGCAGLVIDIDALWAELGRLTSQAGG